VQPGADGGISASFNQEDRPMDESIRTAAISPLRQRLIDDMNMRRFSRET